jgi:hypothetical protein
MTVAFKYHRTIVYVLSGILVILLAFLIFVLSGRSTSNDLDLISAETYIHDPTSKELEAPETPFLKSEEVVVVESQTEEGENMSTILPVTKVLFEYIEVTDGCGPHFEGECLNVRSGPGTEYPVVSRLRNGIVLKVGGKVERDGDVWYKIVFDEWLRYPERLNSDWFVSANYVQVLLDEGDRTVWDSDHATTTNKQIIVDRTTQTLFAYEGDNLFMMQKISTGLELTPTPRGEFTIFKKTPSRYMQGPLPGLASDQYYDLPGVPWNLYFTHQGAVIHGAYWHTSFGTNYSHGCVNLPPDKARELYNWAELGTKVIVKD